MVPRAGIERHLTASPGSLELWPTLAAFGTNCEAFGIKCCLDAVFMGFFGENPVGGVMLQVKITSNRWRFNFDPLGVRCQILGDAMQCGNGTAARKTE